MALARAQITWRMWTLIPSDVSTNTLYFASEGSFTPSFLGEVVDRCTRAIQETRTSGTTQLAAVSPIPNHYVSPARLRIYNMEDPEPREPYVDANIDFVRSNAGSPVPTEVALCLSFRGVYVSGIHDGSRRGRIYLPFTAPPACSPGSNVLFPRPSVGGQAAAQIFANQLATPFDVGNGVEWVVYSPTREETTRIVAGWVNNEWDTQRRRGVEVTSRVEFDIDQEPPE